MTSSDERREVAARLHEFADTDVWLSAMFAELEKFGDTDRRSADVIADLIDPTCHVVSDEKFFGSFGCEEAGTRFVLSCGHETIVDGDYPPSYCSECGARVVSEDE